MDHYVYPDYSGKSLVNVPSTILSLFGLKPQKPTLPKAFYQNAIGTEKIILFIIDGLGNNLYEKECLKHQFFQKLNSAGQSNVITSVFPSTTAAAITSLNSGLTPYEHGLLEWNVYFREIDCVIQTLLFKALIEEDEPKLRNAPKGMLFNQKTTFQYLKEKGIPSYFFTHKTYLESAYNQTAYKGGISVGYSGIKSFASQLINTLNKVQGKAYFCVYWGAVDGTEHISGPDSRQTKDAIRNLAVGLQEGFTNKIDKQLASKIAIFLTADHGQVTVNTDENIYLEKFTGIKNYLNLGPNQKIIPPSGNVRDVFLSIKDEKLEEAKKFLEKHLKGKAKVFKTQELIAKGLFGSGQMHPEFLSRVGNLLILPEGKNTVWWHFSKDYEPKKQLGHHGGLNKDEMTIPFVSCRLSDLGH